MAKPPRKPKPKAKPKPRPKRTGVWAHKMERAVIPIKHSEEFITSRFEALAAHLKAYGGNVFVVCEQFHIKVELGDKLFELLREKAKVFKCNECDKWLDVSQEGLEDLCNPCLDRIDGRMKGIDE